MQTASLFTYRGAGKIAIAKTVPYHLGDVKIFHELVPGQWFQSQPWFLEIDIDTYRKEYFKQLLTLDPRITWQKLHDFAQGHEPVLLCYEKPPFDDWNFCHRRMVAEWFENELGFIVSELSD